MTTHNTHNRQTSMPPVGFEPTISAGERPQNYALDRAATGTGLPDVTGVIKSRRMRWVARVVRMGENRDAYTVLVGKL